jgi:hypothetical protein
MIGHFFGCASLPSNRRFKFKESRQFLICSHTETLSVAAVRVNNPDCSGGRRTASPTDF